LEYISATNYYIDEAFFPEQVKTENTNICTSILKGKIIVIAAFLTVCTECLRKF